MNAYEDVGETMLNVTQNTISGQKSSLVDVPVCLFLWIRPDLIEKVFSYIKSERPSVLFIVSDEGRNETEKKLVKKSRAIVEQIDWNCTVHRVYAAEENLGLYTMEAKAEEYVFQYVDRCVILEDDVLPCAGFLRFCAELLEYYKDDLRVQLICGMNHLGEYKGPQSDYFFSHGGSIWGFALWKRTYLAAKDTGAFQDPYVYDQMCKAAQRDFYHTEKLFEKIKKGAPDAHPEGTETYTALQRYAQRQLNIVATRNMITYMGFTNNAEHAKDISEMPKSLQLLCNLPVFPFEGQMKHAKYVIRDVDYEKKINRIMGFGSFFNSFTHVAERRLRRVLGILKKVIK